MRDETREEPMEVIVESGALIASGVSVKIAEHDGQKCVGCSEFTLHFLTNSQDSFSFNMKGREFESYYNAITTALQKLSDAIEKGGNADA
jgi:hypothetical protein